MRTLTSPARTNLFFQVLELANTRYGIGKARMFDMGVGKLQITCHDVSRYFRKRNFLWDKDIVEWKIRSRDLVLALNQDFAKGKRLKLAIKSVNV